jgi:DnaJ-domain-containing protein 1
VAGQSQANESYQSVPSGPSRFADDLQPLFGDDPDPLFLEESWTMGVPAAVESLHRRRQDRAERERQNRAFRDLDRSAAINFVPAGPADTESFFADRAATIASHYDSAWAQHSAAAQIEDRPNAWSPYDWVPEDRNRQRWIPQGWIPQEVALRLEAVPQPEPTPVRESSSREPDVEMTLAHACELLGVSAASTPAQVRSAYRRRVTECHPDRQQRASEAVRQQATCQLADLNEAYRLLRTTLLRNAA